MAVIAVMQGSSPHMRGALGGLKLEQRLVGIIPAYAGSTILPARIAYLRRDHPRICGEHRSRARSASARAGSSPHMRGAPALTSLGADTHGIIPAYAGSTSSRRRCRRASRDHPRICGEHALRPRSVQAPLGSSPHMRGAPVAGHRGPRPQGIIPAYAGSTSAGSGCGSWRRDHPRICGEHTDFDEMVTEVPGSSPHMRGALVHDRLVHAHDGIIPAYAGSTLHELRLCSSF